MSDPFHSDGPALTSKQRCLLESYAYSQPAWLHPLAKALGPLLRALDHGYPPPHEDFVLLSERGTALHTFPELEAAVAALVEDVSRVGANRTGMEQ